MISLLYLVLAAAASVAHGTNGADALRVTSDPGGGDVTGARTLLNADPASSSHYSFLIRHFLARFSEEPDGDAPMEAPMPRRTPSPPNPPVAPASVEAVPEEQVQVPTPAPAPATPATASSSGNPIAVPPELMGNALDGPPAGFGTDEDVKDQRCLDVDLSSVAVPANPGFRDETSGDESVTGDELWAISFYTMLYTNCERQTRGTYDFIMFTDELMMGMQESIYGISASHDRSEERYAVVGGEFGEGHGGGPRIGTEVADYDSDEDNNGNGIWDAYEIGRRGAEGLVNHGEAMTSDQYTCLFAGTSLGGSNNADNTEILIMYGTNCE